MTELRTTDYKRFNEIYKTGQKTNECLLPVQDIDNEEVPVFGGVGNRVRVYNLNRCVLSKETEGPVPGT